jgi:hypothetical protein
VLNSSEIVYADSQNFFQLRKWLIMLIEYCENKSGTNLGAPKLKIQNEIFTNTAAKFWSLLLEEAHFCWPDSDYVVLTSLVNGKLSERLLYPEMQLNEELQKQQSSFESYQQKINGVLAELELGGAPDSVKLQVWGSSRQFADIELPLSEIDAEIFTCLLAWLLKWGSVPADKWINSRLLCHLKAKDPVRKLLYYLEVLVIQQDIIEGLVKTKAVIYYKIR